jgi:hypothetical protein
MPPSRRNSNMNAASTPYALMQAVLEWLMSAFASGRHTPGRHTPGGHTPGR